MTPIRKAALIGKMVLALGAAAWHFPVLAQLPAMQQYGHVDYLTGGFGLDESTAIKEAMGDYSLAMTFASSAGGRAAYVSQVQVVIRDAYDSTVLNVESRGPFLLARLPAGTYEVFATYNNQTQSRTVAIKDGHSTRQVFEWQGAPDTSRPSSSTSTATPDQPSGSSDDTGKGADRQFAPGSIPGLD